MVLEKIEDAKKAIREYEHIKSLYEELYRGINSTEKVSDEHDIALNIAVNVFESGMCNIQYRLPKIEVAKILNIIKENMTYKLKDSEESLIHYLADN